MYLCKVANLVGVGSSAICLKFDLILKLILDTCQKTALPFNNKLYEQIDGISMGRSHGLVEAGILMTECEKVIFD